ncbi:tRNA methyltransferase, has a role in tRNA modification [Coemansia guatemalensis]|uniref:tRNA methyltransferase, has a role in tRNA modification n=1 Tax=Coemansia guatemalensis TaxID=2761395 RepID=A0A9W8HZK2_9FUNG|nr:tRNA methyltransferase, has a role in tRNA modification [Coemansia guatemalensis]
MRDPVPDTVVLSSTAKEEQYVHAVYEKIAEHFSDTRFKAWPVIERYLKELPVGSVGADVGCGNGKYLGLRPDIFLIGTDRSHALVEICGARRLESLVSDALNQPFRSAAFDFAISIAVIHHFSSAARRRQAIEELLRIVKRGGTVLVFVWALEQRGRRRFADDQDVLVPWVVPGSRSGNDSSSSGAQDQVFHRYYHLFREGELSELFCQIGGCSIVEAGYDRDNWYVIARKD